jgi:nitrite reductase/ring-hydroxylating ferredoxin subunit
MPDSHKVADADDLSADGSRVITEVDGVEIAVFRVDGDFHAVANFCVHQGGPLCEGELCGRTVVNRETWEWEYDDTEKYVLCPWHGWTFDVTTGESVDAKRYAVPTYDVEVRDGEVFVVR